MKHDTCGMLFSDFQFFSSFRVYNPMDNSIKEDLSHITFEELLKIRDKLGTKIYRHTVLNQLKISNKQQSNFNINNSNSNDSESDHEERSLKKRDSGVLPSNHLKNKRFTNNFKRQNRSQPIETSSKKIGPRLSFQRLQPNDEPNRKRKVGEINFRDPRFDPNCGQFRLDKFEQNYAFLTDLKRTELESLKKKLKKAKSEKTKEKLRFLMQRLFNQITADEEREKKKNIQREIVETKRGYQPTVIKQTPKEYSSIDDNGLQKLSKDLKKDTPKLFVNKTVLKKTILVEKFKQLKQTGQLEKYLQRKRKKLASKDRKHMATRKRN